MSTESLSARSPTPVAPEKKAQHDPNVPKVILSRPEFIAVIISLWCTMLLIALDQTILATALPRIASGFNNFTLQGWVASAFVLAQTTFLFPMGQILRMFPSKWCLITGVIVFEAGSLICALAPNVGCLIAGRAISGLGAAGMFIALFQIGTEITTLVTRARLFGLMGSVFGLASIIGPLIGGAFTDHVSWRWCFYINLPIGGAAVFAQFFILKATAPLGIEEEEYAKWSYGDLLRKAGRLDFIGFLLSAGAIVCLNIALQWGGNIRPWNDAGVITCFVLFPVLALATGFWERYLGPARAMLPLTIFKTLSIYAIALVGFTTRFVMLLYTYYIPVYYQAARHHTATRSGIDLLPLLLGTVITVMASGVIESKVKRYQPFMVVGTMIGAVGAGLMYTISPDITIAKLVGFQILVGIGVGLTLQNSLLAVQCEFDKQPELLSQATSLGSFAQFLGGTLGLGVAEPVFASMLDKNLAKFAPQAPHDFVANSPTNIWSGLAPELIPGVVRSYTESLKIVYVIGVAVSGVAFIACLFIKNLRMADKIVPAAEPEEVNEKTKEEV